MRAGVGIHNYIAGQSESDSQDSTKLRLTREVYLPFTQLMIDRNESDEAERLCRLSLREQQKMQGFEHADTALAHGMLGQALVAGLENKNTEEAKREAVEHLEKSLEITTKVMGDVSYVTVSGLQSLGHLYIKEHETV